MIDTMADTHDVASDMTGPSKSSSIRSLGNIQRANKTRGL